jgi:chromosome segregation ATPase
MDLPNFITKALGFQENVEKKLDSLGQAQADLATARQTIGTLTTERDQARAELQSATGKLTAAGAQLKEADEKVATLEAANRDLQAKVEKIPVQIAARANQIAVSQGVMPIREETAAADPRTSAPANLWEQYQAITDPKEASQFWAKHRDQIIKDGRAAK